MRTTLTLLALVTGCGTTTDPIVSDPATPTQDTEPAPDAPVDTDAPDIDTTEPEDTDDSTAPKDTAQPPDTSIQADTAETDAAADTGEPQDTASQIPIDTATVDSAWYDTGDTAGIPSTDTAPAAVVQSNSWYSATVADLPPGLAAGTTPTGFTDGDVIPNAFLTDQFGDDMQLYQFYGQFIVIDLFAQWCSGCQGMASDGEDWHNNPALADLVVLSIMAENITYDPPTVSNLQDWTTAFNLTHPVGLDSSNSLMPFAILGFPTYVLVAPDMTVASSLLFPPSEATLVAEMNAWLAANP